MLQHLLLLDTSSASYTQQNQHMPIKENKSKKGFHNEVSQWITMNVLPISPPLSMLTDFWNTPLSINADFGIMPTDAMFLHYRFWEIWGSHCSAYITTKETVFWDLMPIYPFQRNRLPPPLGIPWSWWQQVPTKFWKISTRTKGNISQKAVSLIICSVNKFSLYTG